jgi:signal transduction histidine kinase
VCEKSKNRAALQKMRNPIGIGTEVNIMKSQSTQILLVEDSWVDTLLLRHTFMRLDRPDWNLVETQTLHEALDRSQHRAAFPPLDLVLLDLGLPDSAGLATLQQFRSAVPDVPVVVLTGLDDDVIATAAIAAGAQDYLVKDDLTMQRLAQTMRFALERQVQLTQLQAEGTALRLALAAERETNASNIRFVGMVSHELRNALGVIQISADFLLEQPTVESRPWLDRILRATTQLLFLTTDLLTLTQLQDDRMQLPLTCLDVTDFCTELVDTIQSTLGDRHRISQSMHGDRGLFQTDPYRLNCILMNLLTNAVKYSPHGGVIDFDVTLDRASIQFRIRDQGIGIPDLEQEKVLESFYRGDNVGAIAGTGLGLTIVARCVETLGGQMTICSAVDVGTTVKVTLPIIG